ncbi:hypothetical protein MHYP_G00279830 [Metynnis hypsauchen]
MHSAKSKIWWRSSRGHGGPSNADLRPAVPELCPHLHRHGLKLGSGSRPRAARPGLVSLRLITIQISVR